MMPFQVFFIEIRLAVGYKFRMEKKDKKPVTFRIEPPIVKKLKFLAVELDRTVTDLLLEAIRDLLKKYEKKTRRDEHGKPSS